MSEETVNGPQFNNRILTVAHEYLKKSWSIIPVSYKSKIPLIDWKPYTQRLPTAQEIQKWFAAKNVNIGIITGAISNLIVVDLDGQEGIDEANRLGLKSPLTVLTGKGRHLYYKWQPNVRNLVRIQPGIDIRSDNGFVLAPPSIHESGKRYRWLKPLLSAEALPQFPNSLIGTISNGTTQEGQKVVTTKEESWIAKALQEMKHGNIDDTLFTVCSRLRSDGYSREDAFTLLEPHALKAGAVVGHLEEKIENVWNRYESRFDRNSSGRTMAMAGFNKDVGTLVIHSPSNPDSVKQYEQLHLSRTKSESELSLKTGYAKLDQMLQGGLKSSRLFTVAARTGVGKTNWLIGVAKTLCKTGKKVLLFSTEMPYAQIWERYIQTLENRDEFREHQFYVCDSFAPNLERVEEAINEIKPDVFMFDHINHVSEEQQELGTFMQGLNFLRRKYDCAGIVTAQLNRSADWVDIKTGEKVTPRMSMIKGSGTIEQASSRVLLLSETRVLPEGTEIIGNLDKNDDGDKGIVHFMLAKNPYRMIEI